MITYEKILSANDTSETKAHMAGILIPKSDRGLMALFPKLDVRQYNPSVYIEITGGGKLHKLRFVYYNNRLHGKGTRNEYRLTHLTSFLRQSNARQGDAFQLSKDASGRYQMEVIKKPSFFSNTMSGPIKLKGWSRIC